jgi:plastocyanin
VQSADRGVGKRYAVDEHAFNPPRARVVAGTTVTFVNNGLMTHTVVAQDGSWSTGPLALAESGHVRFDKAGTYTYACKDHPWAMGELRVE